MTSDKAYAGRTLDNLLWRRHFAIFTYWTYLLKKRCRQAEYLVVFKSGFKIAREYKTALAEVGTKICNLFHSFSGRTDYV